MHIERYSLQADETLTVFEFISTGPRGSINKIVHFQSTDINGIFILAFGDKILSSGKIDDMVISNNRDMEKVLATVVSALYIFTNENPAAFVYITGSTPSRTRLYRMGITHFYNEIKEDFFLFGRIGKEFYAFEPGEEYEAFLTQRKFK